MQAARTLGTEMAKAKIGLVYGGGSLGLMGETARAVLEAGGNVTGIIPEFLIKKEMMLEDVQELIVTTNMHERKMAMFEKADGFVALPGGIGTLEELVEVSTWAQLNQHNKPILVANINEYWSPLLQLLDHMRSEQFIRVGMAVHFDIVKDAREIVPEFQRRVKLNEPHAGKRSIDKLA
jgi:uncharacterized protein (TIGR00730 family)